MSEMHNPPHPGLTLRDDVLPALGLQVGEAAEAWLAQQTGYDLWQARLAMRRTKALANVRSAGRRAA